MNPRLLKIKKVREKFELLALIEEARTKKVIKDNEPIYGLDVKKDPTKFANNLPTQPSSANILNWVPSHQRLWRTVRYESELDPKLFFSINILLNSLNQQFDVILKIGDHPFTASNGETINMKFLNRSMVEVYLEQLRVLMILEGRVCVADVSNPSVLQQSQPPPSASKSPLLQQQISPLSQGSQRAPIPSRSPLISDQLPLHRQF